MPTVVECLQCACYGRWCKVKYCVFREWVWHEGGMANKSESFLNTIDKVCLAVVWDFWGVTV